MVSAKITVSTISTPQKPTPAARSRRTSAMVIPAYFAPMVRPMKNCAAQIASAGGRWCRPPARVTTVVTISGPRIEAPNMPIRLAPCQPTMAQATMIANSCQGRLVSGSPGGLVRSAFQTDFRMKGRATTITSTRVAWISDSDRTLPPASSPKTSMSCKPPGMEP